MAHFAEINSNNEVLRVLLIPNEFEHDGENYLAKQLGMGGTWIQTSYSAKIRGKFAGIGDTYDATADRFIARQQYPSWKLNKNFEWEAPVAFPQDGKSYEWDESTKSWKESTDTAS
jgi:hypothetical protein